MSEAAPSMTFPQALADAMLACYYGVGPRHRTSPLHALDRLQPPTPDKSPETSPPIKAPPTQIKPPELRVGGVRMVPRGLAPGAIPALPTLFSDDALTPIPRETSS